MLFHTVTPEDRDWIVPLVAGSGELACEYCYGNIYMWSVCVHDTQIARAGDFLVSIERQERPYFLFPVGTGSDAAFCELIGQLAAQAAAHGREFELRRVSQQGLDRLNRLFGDRFEAEPDRDDFDYIYDRGSLAELSGKKYHGKRNHVSSFMRDYPDWRYEPITQQNIADCTKINSTWYAEYLLFDKTAADELCAVRRGLEGFFDCGFTGGIIYVGEEPVAYSFGERINERCFVTHIEKSLSEFRTGYSMINNRLAMMLDDVSLINREEDMGHEGLRTAKLSYHPSILYTKYTVKEKRR